MVGNVMRELTDLAERADGILGVAALEVEGDRAYAYNADEVFPALSCIKVLILYEALRRVDRDELRLDDTLEAGLAQRAGGSGILNDLHAGLRLSLKDTLMLMIILSDNTATNMAIDLLGLDEINRAAAELGYDGLQLRNRVDFEAIGDDINRFSLAIPSQFAAFMRRLCRGELLSPVQTHVALDIMARQQYRDMVPRYLPFEPYGRDLKRSSQVKVANKTGFYPGHRGDVAYVSWDGGGYVIAAFVKDSSDERMTPDAAPVLALAQCSKIIYDAFRP